MIILQLTNFQHEMHTLPFMFQAHGASSCTDKKHKNNLSMKT